MLSNLAQIIFIPYTQKAAQGFIPLNGFSFSRTCQTYRFSDELFRYALCPAYCLLFALCPLLFALRLIALCGELQSSIVNRSMLLGLFVFSLTFSYLLHTAFCLLPVLCPPTSVICPSPPTSTLGTLDHPGPDRSPIHYSQKVKLVMMHRPYQHINESHQGGL